MYFNVQICGVEYNWTDYFFLGIWNQRLIFVVAFCFCRPIVLFFQILRRSTFWCASFPLQPINVIFSCRSAVSLLTRLVWLNKILKLIFQLCKFIVQTDSFPTISSRFICFYGWKVDCCAVLLLQVLLDPLSKHHLHWSTGQLIALIWPLLLYLFYLQYEREPVHIYRHTFSAQSWRLLTLWNLSQLCKVKQKFLFLCM